MFKLFKKPLKKGTEPLNLESRMAEFQPDLDSPDNERLDNPLYVTKPALRGLSVNPQEPVSETLPYW